jgi:hypothetical protein
MLASKQFELTRPIVALEAVGKHEWVTIPAGALIKVAAAPAGAEAWMVNVRWEGKPLSMFTIDLIAGGTEIQESACLGVMKVAALTDHVLPTGEHELAIARIVDRIDIENRLTVSSIQEVAAGLDFMMLRSDSRFLVDYLHCRMANPVAK